MPHDQGNCAGASCTVSECQNAPVVKSVQCTFDLDDRPSENYPRPGSKGQYEVLQTTHHSGSITVEVSIKSIFENSSLSLSFFSFSFLFSKITKTLFEKH